MFMRSLSFCFCTLSPNLCVITIVDMQAWYQTCYLRFSSWLAFQSAAFSSCIYNCSVPKKQQQVAAHHSEQYSPQMKIHLFWYSN